MTRAHDVDVPGGVASVTTHGDAVAHLVVVPPLGMPAHVVDPFVADLLPVLRVSIVELPGAGRASAALPFASTRELGAALATVLRAVGGRPHLLGSSLGSMIAQWTAIDAGRGIDRLVLVSSCARGRDALFARPAAKLAMLARPTDPAPARAALAEKMIDDARDRGRVEQVIERDGRDDTELVWLLGAAVTHDAARAVSRIEAKTLVLSGRDDDVIPEPLQDALAAAIPFARRVSIEGAGHAVTIDRPAEAARAVRAFLFD